MTPDKQIESAPPDALESTGPDTHDGKARLAQGSTLSIADPKQLQVIRDSLAAALHPQGPAEDHLVDTMANAQWILGDLDNLELDYLQYVFTDASESQIGCHGRPHANGRCRKTFLLRILSSFPSREAILRRAWYDALIALESHRGEFPQKLKLPNETNFTHRCRPRTTHRT